MARRRVRVVQEFKRPVRDVFAYLGNHKNLSVVFNIPVKRICDGAPDANGPGSVRTLGVPPLAVQETVREVVPNRSIDYEITKYGGPIRNHHGRLIFSETPEGSRVEWLITFDAVAGLGHVVERILERGLARGLRRVAKPGYVTAVN